MKIACLTLLLSRLLTVPLHAQTSPEERKPENQSSLPEPQSVPQPANDPTVSEAAAAPGVVGQKSSPALGIDGFFDMAKEFWPDIDQRVFHGRYESSRP